MQPVEYDAGFVNVTAENIFSFFCQYVYVDILNFVYYLHLLDILLDHKIILSYDF